MKTAQKQGVVGTGMMLSSAVGFWFACRFKNLLSEEMFGFVGIIAMVMFAWGAASVLWMAEKSLSGLGAPLLILVGCFILILAAFYGAIAFALLGGFMAILGAMFFLIK